MKLFIINIVARRSLGLFKRSLTVSDDLFLFSSRSILSTGLREKNATSDPDTSAEHNNRIMITPMEIQISVPKFMDKIKIELKCWGSPSMVK